MNISFLDFSIRVFSSPRIMIAVILTLGVIFVNGWTDAPNAIVSPVCSGTLTMKKAVIIAAICNFFGVFLTSIFSNAVAKNIFEATDFKNSTDSQSALCAALLSVIILAVSAWYFGIPTSESHAIISALIGAGVASGAIINTRVLLYTVIGLFLSVIGGFLLGYYIFNILKNRGIGKKTMQMLQITGAIGMSFMHGAQDGQKFISILMIAAVSGGDVFDIPIWAIIICSLIMGLGTLTGGGRIIKKVGGEMVGLGLSKGVAADIAGSISLFIATVLGLPVSTTHAKTASIMGCGYADGELNKKAAKEMIFAWAITFPVCFILGFVFTKVFGI